MPSDFVSPRFKELTLQVLGEFQRLCSKHGLRYFAIGGTCIGAIRHKGFIPWDDDMDVAMPYEDYNKFLEIAKSELSSGYEITGPHDRKHYPAYYTKLHDARTTFIERGQADYKDYYAGIYLDIFPVFGIPDDPAAAKRVCAVNNLYRKLNITRRYPFRRANSLKDRIGWLLLCPLKLIVPYDFFVTCQEKLLKEYSFDKSNQVIFCWRSDPKHRSNDIGYVYECVFPQRFFAETISVPFENMTIMIPKEYDAYLTRDFGDYMTPPPPEKRGGVRMKRY